VGHDLHRADDCRRARRRHAATVIYVAHATAASRDVSRR
jgi:hypothetical protein